MGSATREALRSLTDAVQTLPAAGLEDAREVLQAARAIEGNQQVKTAIADPVAPADAKAQLADRVLGSLGQSARAIVARAARERWSRADDILDGLEHAGIRMAARAASDADVASEIIAFAGVVSESNELELALSGALSKPEQKAQIVERLLAGKVAPATLVIVDHLVRSPRGRRIGALLRGAADAVAAASDTDIATVTTATPLPAEQLDRLAAGLSASYGRTLQVQQVVDPSIIGGLRVAVADDVIDGTLRSKFNDLRLRLG